MVCTAETSGAWDLRRTYIPIISAYIFHELAAVAISHYSTLDPVFEEICIRYSDLLGETVYCVGFMVHDYVVMDVRDTYSYHSFFKNET